MYHNDGQLCCILENWNFLGGGWGFGTVEIKNCPKHYFFCSSSSSRLSKRLIFFVVGVVVVVEVLLNIVYLMNSVY